jgi:hypothetical protein
LPLRPKKHYGRGSVYFTALSIKGDSSYKTGNCEINYLPASDLEPFPILNTEAINHFIYNLAVIDHKFSNRETLF